MHSPTTHRASARCKALARAWLLEALGPEEVDDVRIEEVRHEGGATWEFTFTFTRRVVATPEPQPNDFLQVAMTALRNRPPRVRKRVRVDLHDPRQITIADPPVD